MAAVDNGALSPSHGAMRSAVAARNVVFLLSRPNTSVI